MKVRIAVANIETREEVDALERQLKNLNGVEVHELGLKEVRLSYDHTEVDPAEIRQAIEGAGGAVQDFRREE